MKEVEECRRVVVERGAILKKRKNGSNKKDRASNVLAARNELPVRNVLEVGELHKRNRAKWSIKMLVKTAENVVLLMWIEHHQGNLCVREPLKIQSRNIQTQKLNKRKLAEKIKREWEVRAADNNDKDNPKSKKTNRAERYSSSKEIDRKSKYQREKKVSSGNQTRGSR